MLPEGDKFEDFIGLISLEHACIGIAQRSCGGILGDEYSNAFFGVTASRHVVFLQDALIAEVWDGVEIEVD